MSLTLASRWVKIGSAATYFDVSTKTIRSWITAGIIDAERVGPRLIRVNVDSLNRAGRSLQYRGGDLDASV